MKKLSTALLLSTAFLAGSAQAQWEGNWLLGVSAGGAWHSEDDDLTFTIFSPASILPPASFNISNDNNNNHFIWGFLGGYQARCCNWLVGLEVNVDWRGNDDDIDFTIPTNPFTGGFGSISRDRDAVWGITGRFGYFVNSCIMPYIRLGADWGKRDFDFTFTTTDLGALNVTVSSDSDNNGRWGFVGGIGLEWFMPMINCLSLRAEWDYHSRKHHHDGQAIDAVPPPEIFTINGGHHRHENTLIASLVYNFSM